MGGGEDTPGELEEDVWLPEAGEVVFWGTVALGEAAEGDEFVAFWEGEGSTGVLMDYFGPACGSPVFFEGES